MDNSGIAAMLKTASAQTRAQRLNQKIVAPLSRAANKAQRGLLWPVAQVAAVPGKALANTVGSLLFGRKAKFGPMAGHRLAPVKGGPGEGMRAISAHEYDEIMKGAVKGKAYQGVVGGKKVYFARKFAPGGAVGLVRRHPIAAASLGLLGLYLSKNPQHTQTAKDLAIGGFLPQGPSGAIDPNLMAEFQRAPSTNNPLAQQVWG